MNNSALLIYPLQQVLKDIQKIEKNLFRNLQNPEYWMKEFMENSKFRASQRLIKRNTSN